MLLAMSRPGNNRFRSPFSTGSSEQPSSEDFRHRRPKQRLLELREYLERLSWETYLATKDSGRGRKSVSDEQY
jgi:hypothetical protein